jgi:hypothetical protein
MHCVPVVSLPVRSPGASCGHRAAALPLAPHQPPLMCSARHINSSCPQCRGQTRCSRPASLATICEFPCKPRAVRRVLLSGRARRRTPSTAARGPCTLVCGALKSPCALWPCAGVLKTLGASYADAAQAERQSGQGVMPCEDALPLLQSMLDRSDEAPYAQWCAI